MNIRPGRAEAVPWRFEYKYRLSVRQYYQLRCALQAYMEPDPYSLRAPGGRYLVRSLYFDNDGYQSYFEKVEGNFGRIKYRIRTYTDRLDDDPPVRVELKARWGHSIEKYSSFVTVEDYLAFMGYGHWPGHGDPVRTEFERMFHLKALRPRVLVEYRREGFIPRARGDLRVTLDHEVQSSSADSLFPARPHFRHHCRHMIVLEIKCRQERPAWLSNLVRRYGLRYVANSKYTQGVDAVCPDLFSPY